jgi:hypothetical protein
MFAYTLHAPPPQVSQPYQRRPSIHPTFPHVSLEIERTVGLGNGSRGECSKLRYHHFPESKLHAWKCPDASSLNPGSETWIRVASEALLEQSAASWVPYCENLIARR